MKNNVTKLYPSNAAENADNVLEQAAKIYEDLLIIGYTPEGDLEVRATTTLNLKDILFLVEIFKANLLSGEYYDED